MRGWMWGRLAGGTAQAPERLKSLDSMKNNLNETSQPDLNLEASSEQKQERSPKRKRKSRRETRAFEHEEAVRKAVLPEHLRSAEIRELLQDWADQRRKKGKFLTTKGMAMTLKKLGDFQPDEVKIALRDAISGDYTGVFPRALSNRGNHAGQTLPGQRPENLESRTIFVPDF